MTPLLSALGALPLNQDIPDPEDVTAGGVGAIVLGLLVVAVVFLGFSFRKQLRKVRFEQPDSGDSSDDGSSPGNGEEPRGESGGSRKP